MQEDIKLVDLVIELVDARIPASSHNPDIDSLAANKSRIVLLNKADLALVFHRADKSQVQPGLRVFKFRPQNAWRI